MSEHIVHTAVLEDSFSIAAHLAAIPADFREILADYLDFARLGCITVSGDQFTFRLLEEFKPKWQNRDTLLKAKMAFVLGWISHRACDRQMKPIWREPGSVGRGSDVDPSLSPTECSIYHEGAMYNNYYAASPVFRYAIFDEKLSELPGCELIKREEMTRFVQESFAVNLMNIQTIPTNLPAQQFSEELCMRAQKFYVDLQRYKKSAGNPNPELTKNYLTDINWFDPKDRIIAVAQMLRRNEVPTGEAVGKALDEQAGSHYGKALQLSLRYFIAATDYFTRDEMSLDELKERLDIGKLGPNGLRV